MGSLYIGGNFKVLENSMREESYRKWLLIRGLGKRSIGNKISYLKKIENVYGNIEEWYEKDECLAILSELTYSRKDEIENIPVKHKIILDKDANIRTATNSYKSALTTYTFFLKDFLQSEGEEFDVKKILKVKKNIGTVGMETFVKYYYAFKTKNINDVKAEFEKDDEFKNNSTRSTKISTGVRIFNDNNQKEALKIIISSCRVKKEVIERANEILNNEYDNEEVLNYIFVRPEYQFGKQIVQNLFSDYEIKEQYRVLDYFIDWYIPELNLAIEFDEKYHKRTKNKDENRQKEIKRKLGCNFIRYSE